jgi:hypothetical protein
MLAGFARAMAKALDLTSTNAVAIVLITCKYIWKVGRRKQISQALERALRISHLRMAGWGESEDEWKAWALFSGRGLESAR